MPFLKVASHLLMLLAHCALAQAQTPLDGLSMTVLMRETDVNGQMARLWIQITNEADSPQVLCRPGWGYSWIAQSPSPDNDGGARASVHGCGDDEHDGLWMLLPGESRFDSYEIKAPPQDAALEVEVDVMTVRGGSKSHRQLTWKGRVADAYANSRKIKMPARGAIAAQTTVGRCCECACK